MLQHKGEVAPRICCPLLRMHTHPPSPIISLEPPATLCRSGSQPRSQRAVPRESVHATFTSWRIAQKPSLARSHKTTAHEPSWRIAQKPSFARSHKTTAHEPTGTPLLCGVYGALPILTSRPTRPHPHRETRRQSGSACPPCACGQRACSCRGARRERRRSERT